MKYGKEFQQILEDSSFPPEWKASAIEYRRLKKLIKDVVAELTSMGLSQDVLHKLLVTEEVQGDGAIPAPEQELDNEDVLEFEFESEEGSPATLRNGDASKVHHHEPKEVILDPVYEHEEENVTLPGDSDHPHNKKFRLRLLSETSQARALTGNTQHQEGPLRPISVADLITAREKHDQSTSPEHSEVRDQEQQKRGRRVIRKAILDGHGGAKAEYVLTGDPSKPIPQLRLHLSTSPSPDPYSHSPSPSPSTDETDTEDEGESDEQDTEQGVIQQLPQSTPRPFQRLRSPVLPSSPTLNRMRAAKSPIWAIASGADPGNGMGDLSLGKAAVEELPPSIRPIHHHPTSTHSDLSLNESTSVPISIPTTERDFVIPLSSDLAFFSLLTVALTSLSSFHTKQQTTFRDSVESLCTLVSRSISPQSNIEVLPTPFTPSGNNTTIAQPRIRAPSSKTSRKDLYAWREIFTLWIEAEIFESSAERDRGERSVEQAEARLQKFANEVIKRGLGDRRTMKGKRIREAWEEFLRLNVLLLDLKRFQIANINAARKILKKHDKRTALTASAGFPDFVKSTLSARMDKDGNISTWAFYSTSLPHILLASLTNTLLPILPSLDDYACLICTSIAFKPIRLNCGHLFCVRCLVKMQKAGKAECPLCRSKVVLLADRGSLDLTVMNFMKEWFPKEVKMKQKENEIEAAKEQALETGMDTRCIIM
ncbi:hypothetical protein CI109_103817 [Kwoniella shandongensis]|uniref:Uncharacterized protein n=1 Tax=Kwoniella shandongensis TaxID=1734106 RepID=A0A5M6C726_9TREE|nr:uncharacterized protein CI109_000489 [Kwoniella shandongensis]KAA5530918.1 hypothetical protein CI109_000489 [Kwoniella shandongensis]